MSDHKLTLYSDKFTRVKVYRPHAGMEALIDFEYLETPVSYPPEEAAEFCVRVVAELYAKGYVSAKTVEFLKKLVPTAESTIKEALMSIDRHIVTLTEIIGAVTIRPDEGGA